MMLQTRCIFEQNKLHQMNVGNVVKFVSWESLLLSSLPGEHHVEAYDKALV